MTGKYKNAPSLKKRRKLPPKPEEKNDSDIDLEKDSTDYTESDDSDGDDGMEPLEHEFQDVTGNNMDVNTDDEGDEIGKLSSKRKRKLRPDVNKPPSAQEVAHLRETENLFHSNLFRLQIEEMLLELKIKKKWEDYFISWFSSFKKIIMEMKIEKEHILMKQKWVSKLGLSTPVLQELPVDGTFQFIPPTSIYVTGSHAVGCSLGPKLNVDIAIEMPKECFENRDIVNERYHRKRALYLCSIVAHLMSSNIVSIEDMFAPKFVLSYAADPLVPALEVVPTGPLHGRAIVFIHITACEESFKLTRLGPSKSCVRERWFYNDNSVQEGPPTPWRNSSILLDLAAKRNENLKMEVLQNSQSLKDAIILLKVWLKQRELDQGFLSFGNYLMSMLVVYLARCRKLSTHMSSYQIARTVWNFLKDQDWTVTDGGITLCEKINPGAPSIKDFHCHYEVVFVDCTGYFNLAAHMNAVSFQRVKNESARAIQFLDDTSLNSFLALFMNPAPFIRHFDHVLCFHNLEDLLEMVSRIAQRHQLIDGNHHRMRLASKLMMAVFEKGLGKRVKEWGIRVPNIAKWSVKEAPKPYQGPLLFGLNLNSEYAYSIVDKGPAANMPEAEEFRDFWGNKSELRRFQDGNISEAVVWLSEKEVTFSERRLVCRSILKYLLKQKLGLSPDCLFYFADQLEPLLHCPNVKPASFLYGTGEEATLCVLSALTKLSSTLRELPDLSLDLSSIQGVSSVCRYADVMPPLSTTHHSRNQYSDVKGSCMAFKSEVPLTRLPPLVSPVEVICHLAQSGKWPDDAGAVKRIRAAFNINISECLKKSGLTAQAFPTHVDVLKDGFVFRLRVAYGREPSLLRRRILPSGLVTSVESKEAQVLERETILIPRLSGYLHGLHQQLPAFGPSACLAKRWLSSQMFRFSHFPEIVLELLVAYLFVRPEPYAPPAQPQTAFLRFLHLLSTTNWHTEPIILNFNSELNRDELHEVERRFIAERSQLPPLYISTPTDGRSSLTREAPNLTILLRLAILAAESLRILEGLCLTKNCLGSDVWKQVFRPSLDPYNMLIHLNPYLNSKRVWCVDYKSKKTGLVQLEPYKKTKDEKIPITGFNPVECYLQELEGSYGDFALFFHDTFGGSTIGVVWKPSALEPKELKISNANGRTLVLSSHDKDPQLLLNKDAIVEDFYIIGDGLVKSIELLNNSV